jgi:hypothetical protein
VAANDAPTSTDSLTFATAQAYESQ